MKSLLIALAFDSLSASGAAFARTTCSALYIAGPIEPCGSATFDLPTSVNEPLVANISFPETACASTKIEFTLRTTGRYSVRLLVEGARGPVNGVAAVGGVDVLSPFELELMQAGVRVVGYCSDADSRSRVD